MQLPPARAGISRCANAIVRGDRLAFSYGPDRSKNTPPWGRRQRVVLPPTGGRLEEQPAVPKGLYLTTGRRWGMSGLPMEGHLSFL